MRSLDYPTSEHERLGPPAFSRQLRRLTFDELVILGQCGELVIHVEQMDERTYFVAIGDDKLMVSASRDGKVKKGEWYR